MPEKTKSAEQLLVDYEKVCDTYPVHECTTLRRRRFIIRFNVICDRKSILGIDLVSDSEVGSVINAVQLLEKTSNIKVVSFHTPSNDTNYYKLDMYSNPVDRFNIANRFVAALELNLLKITRYEYQEDIKNGYYGSKHQKFG